jgi:hypothetical protein
MPWILLLAFVLNWHPRPPTAAELIQNAKQKSISKVCKKPRKTKTVKEMCARWEK